MTPLFRPTTDLRTLEDLLTDGLDTEAQQYETVPLFLPGTQALTTGELEDMISGLLDKEYGQTDR